MALSVRKAKQIMQHRRALNRKVKDLKRQAQKAEANTDSITLQTVSLGDLRRRFKHTHKPLHPAVIRQVPSYRRFQSDPNRRLMIYGSDGGLLVARQRLNDPEAVEDLFQSIQALPPTKERRNRGIYRGDYDARHYGVWASYSKTTFVTRETKDDKEHAPAFIKKNTRIFNCLSQFLGEVAPQTFKEYQLYPISPGTERQFGAFLACVINNGGNSPDETKPHRDVREAIYGYSGLIACGHYTGGALILYDLNIIIELEPGDMLIFPDSLIHHSNEPAVGERCSVVAFTQENVYDFWYRNYGMKLRRQTRRSKKKTKDKIRKTKDKVIKKEKR